MEFNFHCHVRKAIKNLKPAKITIEVTRPNQAVLRSEHLVYPTINWVAGSTKDDSVPVKIDIPDTWRGNQCQFAILVEGNDVLVCGYQDYLFQIVTNPLWDGQRGPYDISGHKPGGGTMGTGSLAIEAGKTVTFDAVWEVDPVPNTQNG
jgi:hypothetical protein